MHNRRNTRTGSRRRRGKGFSLIELMAVMLIIGMLAAGVGIGINSAVQRARVRATQSQIAQLGQAISAFQLECGFFPGEINDLIRPPTSGRRCPGYPAGGFMSRKVIPKDPWNADYNYTSPGIHDPEGYDLWSNGPDGEEGTSDDITSWGDDSLDDSLDD